MARDISSVYDAIDQAKRINSGLDALVALLLGCRDADVPAGIEIAELLQSIQKNMEQTLQDASEGLGRAR